MRYPPNAVFPPGFDAPLRVESVPRASMKYMNIRASGVAVPILEKVQGTPAWAIGDDSVGVIQIPEPNKRVLLPMFTVIVTDKLFPSPRNMVASVGTLLRSKVDDLMKVQSGCDLMVIAFETLKAPKREGTEGTVWSLQCGVGCLQNDDDLYDFATDELQIGEEVGLPDYWDRKVTEIKLWEALRALEWTLFGR